VLPTLVHLLPARIDADNVDEFQDVVGSLLERHGALILDCSQLEHINLPGMRALEAAAKNGSVTLVRATPIVHLLASVFGLDVDDGVELERRQPAIAALSELTQFESARLARRESQVETVVTQLSAWRPDRDWFPDLR
jgi:anti-anti-sigma regulatory factor